MAGRSDLQLGADHERVRKLADAQGLGRGVGVHGAGRNRAAVGRDKVHQAKTQRQDTRVRGNGKSLVHRAGRFDQHMQRQGPGATAFERRCVNGAHCGVNVRHGLNLGNHQVAKHVARAADNCRNILRKGRVVDRMDTYGDPRRNSICYIFGS